jgi:hypothetical protein
VPSTGGLGHGCRTGGDHDRHVSLRTSGRRPRHRRSWSTRHLLVTRAALYAAELDGALRAATRAKRTLDDALRELYLD